MRKKEIVKIMKPYWVDYLENHGKLERELQLKSFVNSFKYLSRFGLFNLLYFDKYIRLMFDHYVLLGKFWAFSKMIAKLKKIEMDLDDLKLKLKDHLTSQDIKEIEEKKIVIQEEFKIRLYEYFKSTLGSSERETRLWVAYVVMKEIY
jgi:hypothetical protein